MTGMNDEGRQWYVVNTYSGHENKVKENLEKRVESMGLQDVLFQIVIPEHVETEIKDGKKINKTKNMFPGYVLVEMIYWFFWWRCKTFSSSKKRIRSNSKENGIEYKH